MAKIVVDARFYGTEHTGLGRYTMNVLDHLPNKLPSHKLFILLTQKYYTTLKFPANCTKILCNIPHYSWSEQVFLPHVLKQLNASLLYTFHFNTPIFSKLNTIVTVHDLIKTYFEGKETTTRSPIIYKLKRLGYHYIIQKTLNKAVEVIVPTNTVKNQILANFPQVKPEHIHAIPEAPDPIFTQKTNIMPSTLDLPANYILFVGNAYPHKNLKVLLDAFKNLKIPDLHLVLVSKHTSFLARELAPYEPRLIHRLSDLTDTELVAVYKNAKLLVTPSLMEGYGLVGLEALMVNTRVIASDISVYREVYKNQVTYFDPKDANSLMRAIQKTLLQKPSKPLVFDRTWENVAESIAEVINASCTRLRSTQ